MTETCRGEAVDRHRQAENLEDPHKMETLRRIKKEKEGQSKYFFCMLLHT